MAERQSAARIISFAATAADRALVLKIIDRAEREGLLGGYSREDLEMDLIATHANGCPIDFNKLLDAGPFDFTHDIYGIFRHIDRRSGQLTDFFLPRCSAGAR